MTAEHFHHEAALLIAFVDGQLDETDNQRAKRLIESDPDAAQFVDRLRQSDLPYEEAFEPLLDVPVPEHVTRLVEEADLEISQQRRFGLRQFWPGIAAGLVVGVLSSALFFNLKPVEIAPDFAEHVSQYQSLYQRATVAGAPAADNDQLAVLIEENLGQSFPVPAMDGLEFRRGQLLQFRGEPLIQLVYLGEAGVPVAFCITRTATRKDEQTTFGSSHGLNFAHWKDSGLEFVVVSDSNHSIIDLTAEIKRQVVL